MRHSSLALALCLCAALVDAPGALAARSASSPSSGHGCQVGSLAAPGDPGYGPYSADYYAPQFSFGYNTPVHLIFAAYTPLNDTPPAVVSYQVLRSDFTPLPNQPYAVKATGCQQNQSGPHPTTSLFTYSADWTTPADNGGYYLAVSFEYSDGTLVEYFANITVRDPPETITGGSIHWETRLSGIGYQQSSAAYNLFSPGASDTVTAHTSFYFDANPAAACAAATWPPGSDSTTFIQGGMDNNLENLHGGSVFLLDTPPHVPYYKDGWPRQTRSFTFSQNLGGVRIDDTGTVFIEHGSYLLGGHIYRYHVEIDEPFLLRSGGVTFVHVGSYVLDNGITGPAGWQGAADNLGEGQGFRFYVNPSTPEPPATMLTVSAPSADVTLSRYDVAPSGAVEAPNGAAMAWQYEMHLYKVFFYKLRILSRCQGHFCSF